MPFHDHAPAPSPVTRHRSQHSHFSRILTWLSNYTYLFILLSFLRFFCQLSGSFLPIFGDMVQLSSSLEASEMPQVELGVCDLYSHTPSSIPTLYQHSLDYNEMLLLLLASPNRLCFLRAGTSLKHVVELEPKQGLTQIT